MTIHRYLTSHIDKTSSMEDIKLNQRRAGGGGVWTPSHLPQVFRRYLKVAVFEHLLIHLLRTRCKNFKPSSLEVRSPGYVT